MPANHHEADLLKMHEALARNDFGAAACAYAASDPDPDATRAFFSSLDTARASRLLASLSDNAKAREVLLWLPRERSAAILTALDPDACAGLIEGLPSDERADLLAALPDETREAVRVLLPADAQADAAKLLQYAAGTAGGLMETELLSYPVSATVRDAIRDLRANQEKYAGIGVQYVYLVDDARRLLGVAPIRDLMLAREEATLSTLIKRAPANVQDTATTHEVAMAFDEHPFLALPVVDERGVLLGVVNRADATEREQEEAEDDFRVSQGIVGGEELRSMPIAHRLRRRGVWLGVNLLLCLGGAAVIALHQHTLAKAIAVVSVLPVVSATSGNAAMQAAAVSIRELALGVIDPRAWLRVLKHELMLAALLALPLGGAVAFLSRAWGASWTIGAAVGVAMALNALVAIGIGAICPLLLRQFKIDPALASGPITTTMADVSGFALTLGLVALAA